MVYSDAIPLIFCCRSCRHVEPYCFSFILTLASLAGCQRYDPCAGARPFHAKPSAGFRHDAGIPRREKHFAEMAKAFGEASMKNNDLDTGEQARQFAFGQVRDVVSEQVNQQLESWLSARGSASVDINVDNEGHFNGSRGSWFIPLQDKQRYLTGASLVLRNRLTDW